VAKYPYLANSGSLKRFISEIQSTGVPDKVTQDELASRGFKSTNDRPIISVLKFINFLDGSAKPTENWINYRDKQQSRSVIASCIKTAYSELFNLYPNAHEKDAEALRNFFSTRIDGGDKVLTQTVGTFRALSELGDFTAADTLTMPIAKGNAPDIKLVPSQLLANANNSDRQLVINLNIQLQLPATDNSEIYDKIFQSLKKNVLEK